jgi:histidyl-tRNA synthetase
MQTPTGPKGTRDLYPEDITLRQHIFASWHKTCKRYGFEYFEGPMFEHLEVYTQKSGPEIEKQLYAFIDKGERRIALRPELTPTLARMVAAKGSSLKRPIRWYSTPQLFRYERMQKGRLREFSQLNMDIVGIQDVSADAELIAAAVDMMRDLGFTSEDFTVRISSRALLEEMFVFFGCAPGQLPAIYAVLDKKNKLPADEFNTQLAAVVPDAETGKKIHDLLAATTIEEISAINPNLAAVRNLHELFSLLSVYGFADYCAFDIGVVRGLTYYTGIVFELFDVRRELRAMAGGGRYDNLVKMYGGQDTPAVGFAAGDVPLAELMKVKGIEIPRPPRCEAYVVACEGAFRGKTIALLQTLRNAGISAEAPLRKTGLGKQMELADAARARLVVFAGGEEEEQGVVRIKNMQDGTELTVPRAELVHTIKTGLKFRID